MAPQPQFTEVTVRSRRVGTADASTLCAQDLGRTVTVSGIEVTDWRQYPADQQETLWTGRVLALSIYPEAMMVVLAVDGARTAVSVRTT